MNFVRGGLSRIVPRCVYHQPFRIRQAPYVCTHIFGDRHHRFSGLNLVPAHRQFSSAAPASEGKKAVDEAAKKEAGEQKSWIDQISAPHDLIPYKSPIFWILIAILIPVCILNQQFDNRAKLKNDDLKEQRLAQRQKTREEMEKAAASGDSKSVFVQPDFSGKN